VEDEERRPNAASPELLRYGLLSLPALFVGSFLLVPAGLTVISFWERKGFSLHPAFSFAAYRRSSAASAWRCCRSACCWRSS
jgi:hypothetical protein